MMFSVILFTTVLLGQQAAEKTPEAQPKPASPDAAKAIQGFKADVTAYDMRLRDRPDEMLVLREEPLLHWGNPERNGEDGAAFVWMLDGRPEVIGGVFTFRRGGFIHRKHQYHSLAACPLTAEFRGERVWAPKSAGVTFRPVPEAPEPAATARQRLTQMKNLARDFSARLIDNNNQLKELRLVTQPLIRYEPKDKRIVDGGLFAFVVGTDPEAILLLEARTENERTAWTYAMARYHFADLKASYKGREIWHAETLPGMAGADLGELTYQDSVYASYRVSITQAAE